MIRKLCVAVCILLVCGLASVNPVLGDDNANGQKRIPALNTVSGAAVLVPEVAVKKSPVLEPADIVVELSHGAFFILLEDDSKMNPEEFRSALEEELRVDVEILSTEPFLWVVVGEDATRDQVHAALEEIENELRWMAGRSVGWGTYW